MNRRAKILLEALEPTVVALGYELVDLEFNSSAKHGRLRIYIDAADGIGVDDCSKVSHQVSGVLDVEDLIKGEYDLEISSPGLDRILRTSDHYRRFIGEKINVVLTKPLDGRRKFNGALRSVDNEQIVLDFEGQALNLKLEDIEKTRLVPEFSQ